MLIVYYGNFICHHDVHVADELYKLTDKNYFFVELEPMPESYKKAGYPDFSDRPYLIQAWKSKELEEKAAQLAVNSDVMLVGGPVALKYEKLRCQHTDLLTIEVTERILKRGIINLLSPRFLKWYLWYLLLFRKKNVYKLCCSAYTSSDMMKIGAFRNRCFKWGYFTALENYDVEGKIFRGNRIMWVSRLIGWKHPEMAVYLAGRLKNNHTPYHIDIFGAGEKTEELEELVRTLGVEDLIIFHGNVPNRQIVDELRNHDIVLATSDRNEGWGAIVSEAMSNGCVIIGSNETGAVPYLVKDGYNGYVFKTNNHDSLYQSVLKVMDNPEKCKEVAIHAYKTIKKLWSPHVAAENLLQLIEDLNNNRETSIKEGPCSVAEILNS